MIRLFFIILLWDLVPRIDVEAMRGILFLWWFCEFGSYLLDRYIRREIERLVGDLKGGR
jgi:hypothetical protein